MIVPFVLIFAQMQMRLAQLQMTNTELQMKNVDLEHQALIEARRQR